MADVIQNRQHNYILAVYLFYCVLHFRQGRIYKVCREGKVQGWYQSCFLYNCNITLYEILLLSFASSIHVTFSGTLCIYHILLHIDIFHCQIKDHKEAGILAETALGNIYIRSRDLGEVKVRCTSISITVTLH